MMLRHMGLNSEAANIEQAIFKVLAEGKVCFVFTPHPRPMTDTGQTITGDLGGKAKTYEYADAVIKALK
jgi:isocitrate dehydrogenase (NAD+)